MSSKFTYPTPRDMVEKMSLGGRPLLNLVEAIQQTYMADARPWVVGYSGGKDSTALLELVYIAVSRLNKAQRDKPIFVVSSDTLVETPVVVNLIKDILKQVEIRSQKAGLPISTHQVFPQTRETFWVNLLGKGYPAPTTQFRWCTDRMKIDPVSRFIKEKLSEYPEVIIALGARTQESTSRAQVMKKHRIEGSPLSKHQTLPSAYIYTPIEAWTHDDVWEFLLSAPCPWGGDNFTLFTLYKNSNAGECPLVIDRSTPSCGNSRFGCWVCTVVKKDRAMEGLVEGGETWLQPLLDFRDMLAETTNPTRKHKYRNFRRRTGKVTYASGAIDVDGNKTVKPIPGPYWMEKRQEWLKKLLRVEKQLRDQGHDMELITRPELHRIRQEWISDPIEPDWADSLPGIYHDVYGEHLDWVENDSGVFSKPDSDLLAELEKEYNVPTQMVMKLLELELSLDDLSKRDGIFNRIESILSQDWGTLEEINTRKKRLFGKEYEERNIQLRKEREGLKRGFTSLDAM